jgi:hypothetical protein
MITIHVSLLILVIVLTIALVAWQPGCIPRSPVAVFLRMLPLLVIGVIFSLLLSVDGHPVPEWAIPTMAIAIVGLFCRSKAGFRYGTHVILMAAIVLCCNWMRLVQTGDYTSAPRLRENYERASYPKRPPAKAERLWHTPLTDLYRVVRS